MQYWITSNIQEHLRAAAATGSVSASAAAASVGLAAVSAGFVVSAGLSSFLLLLRRPLSFDLNWESALGAVDKKKKSAKTHRKRNHTVRHGIRKSLLK
jgi:hypothetical protein